MEDRTIKDRTLGAVHIVEVVDNDTRSLHHDIIAEGSKIGTLDVTLQAYDDPVYLWASYTAAHFASTFSFQIWRFCSEAMDSIGPLFFGNGQVRLWILWTLIFFFTTYL